MIFLTLTFCWAMSAAPGSSPPCEQVMFPMMDEATCLMPEVAKDLAATWLKGKDSRWRLMPQVTCGPPPDLDEPQGEPL